MLVIPPTLTMQVLIIDGAKWFSPIMQFWDFFSVSDPLVLCMAQLKVPVIFPKFHLIFLFCSRGAAVNSCYCTITL